MSAHNELLASQRILSTLEMACEYSEKMLDNIPSAFVMLDQNHQIIRCNKFFCELIGYTMETALHLDFSTFFSSENREILLHHCNQVRRSEQPGATARLKLEIISADKQQAAKPFYWRISSLEHNKSAEERIISLIGDDLSTLYQSELKLMSIFSSIPLGLMMLDRHGCIQDVLSEYCHVLLQQDTLVGESLQALLIRHNPDHTHALQQAFGILSDCTGKGLQRLAEKEAELGILERLKIKGEGQPDRWIKTRFQPIAKNNALELYMVSIEDITASCMAQKQIERADMLGKQAQAMYECAIRDPLSGLFTRLYMVDSINRLISSATRGSLVELAIVMFDLDNFKSINDTYGHQAGDLVIREFGHIVRLCTRDTDVAVRYGGEEFLLALPCNDTHEQGGAIVAERIREKLAATPIAIGNGQILHVTSSGGVAYCQPKDTLESLLQRADQLLYTAKHNGKNRISIETH